MNNVIKGIETGLIAVIMAGTVATTVFREKRMYVPAYITLGATAAGIGGVVITRRKQEQELLKNYNVVMKSVYVQP